MHHQLLRSGTYDSVTHPTSQEPAARGPHPDVPLECIALPSFPLSPTLAPHSNSITGFAQALAQAHQLYGPPKSEYAAKTAVVMVVQHDNLNITDERPIEYALWDIGVPCFRCEYREVMQETWFASASSNARNQSAALEVHGRRDESLHREEKGEDMTGRELLSRPSRSLPPIPPLVHRIRIRRCLSAKSTRSL